MSPHVHRVALVWSGSIEDRRTLAIEKTRLARIAEALRAVGLEVEPAVYGDDFADEVREQLSRVDAVLVWVNPGERGRDRVRLDAMLRDVANAGVFVSAHPDVIGRMGTKEVLYTTRSLGWGTDTRRYATPAAFREEFPHVLREGAPRVLKQVRGNGGNGVWKVALVREGSGAASASEHVLVRHALRGSCEQAMTLDALFARFEPSFDDGGCLIDQPYAPRLTDGMIRCYLVRDRVAGFGEQLVNALYPAPDGGGPDAAPDPGPRLYYPPTRPDFQRIKYLLETTWLPETQRLLGIASDALPVVWDADFLYGPRNEHGDDTYILCEINVSAVFPFPDEVLAPLARETLARVSVR